MVKNFDIFEKKVNSFGPKAINDGEGRYSQLPYSFFVKVNVHDSTRKTPDGRKRSTTAAGCRSLM